MRACSEGRCENLMGLIEGIRSSSMGCVIAKGRKTVRPPAGCEGHMTRREAAICLGLPSEYKIRQLEREGRLHAVRGRMGTAFYPESEVLNLRAELALPPSLPGRWSDADLIALLRQPTASGRPRTAVDLVLEAKINISRAEKVYRFWHKSGAEPLSKPTACSQDVIPPARPVENANNSDTNSVAERRSPARRAHDGLVRALRDPDPQVRAQAFAKLKDSPRP
jgi:hypothetical protein